MTQFSWQQTTRTVAWVNLGLTLCFFLLSVVTITTSFVNETDLLSEPFILLVCRSFELITAILLLRYSNHDMDPNLVLKRTWFWFYVNLTILILRLYLTYSEMLTVIPIIEICVRVVCLCVVSGYIHELKKTISTPPSSC